MQRYFSKELKNNLFCLNNDDIYHIKTVMRMKEDNKIEIVYKNELYIAKINDKFEFELVEKKNIKIDKIEIVLVLPLLKEQKMDFVLQKATELGVSKIIPINTSRTIVKIEKEKEDKKLIRWNKIVKEASEQSKRLDIPVITNIRNIKDLNETGLKLVCSTIEKENKINNFLKNNKNYDKIVIVVGPEGGLAADEERLLNELGFVSISLGNLIMRVETVPIYLLSVLNYEKME